MAWSSTGLAVSAGMGAVVADNALVAVLVGGAMGLICTWIAAHSTRTALSGLLSLVVFTIYVGYPGPTEAVLAQMSLILLGAGFKYSSASSFDTSPNADTNPGNSNHDSSTSANGRAASTCAMESDLPSR